MADEISVLVIDSDHSVAEAWASRMKQLGFAQCSSAHPDLPMDELAALKPDLAILGPLGAMTEGTKMVDAELMKTCIRESVPPGTEELNLKAFQAGRALYGKAAKGV